MARITAIVKGGFWEVNAGGAMTLHDQPDLGGGEDIRSAGQEIQDLLRGGRAVLRALLGVAPGGVALAQFMQVEANVELGGKRNVVMTTFLNRATTAADVTFYNAQLLAFGGLKSAVNVPNLDGNPLGTR